MPRAAVAAGRSTPTATYDYQGKDWAWASLQQLDLSGTDSATIQRRLKAYADASCKGWIVGAAGTLIVADSFSQRQTISTRGGRSARLARPMMDMRRCN